MNFYPYAVTPGLFTFIVNVCRQFVCDFRKNAIDENEPYMKPIILKICPSYVCVLAPASSAYVEA